MTDKNAGHAPPRADSKFQSAVLLVGSIFLAVVGAEVIVRKAAPQEVRLESPGMFVTDSVLGYRLASNYSGFRGNRVEYLMSVKTDELGMSVSDAHRRAVGHRILFLGDSFTFGQGVTSDAAVPFRLKHYLEMAGVAAQVFNAGVPGYGTSQEARWLEEFGFEIKPDLIVVGVFLGNDLLDNIEPGAVRLRHGTVTAPPPSWHTPVTGWLYKHSHVYLLVRGVALTIAERFGGASKSRPGALDAIERPSDSLQRAELDSTSAALEELGQSANSLGAPVVAILIPDALQVENNESADRRGSTGSGRTIDLDYPNKAFARLLCNHRIPFLDLTDAFRGATRDGARLYYRRDRHWNAAGHDLAARILADAIVGSSSGAVAMTKLRVVSKPPVWNECVSP